MLSTNYKILIARCLSTQILLLRRFFGYPAEVVVTRRGLVWALNLKEGIDFSIYLLGGFEVKTLKRYAELVKEGDIVLDIGANVGAHTLPLAQLVGSSGKVFSFEPTAYAFNKQQANILLNPQLATRVENKQMMLVATTTDPLPESIYSSWPLEVANDLHDEHRGRLMATQGAIKGTLDDFIQNAKIDKIDFIKLDVDGNEYDILAGGKVVIAKFKPQIMLELAPYVYDENPDKFDQLLNELWNMGYHLFDMLTKRLLPDSAEKIRKIIPTGCGLNVLAKAQEGYF